MKNCEDIRELLSARLDGELTAEEARLLDGHLASCEACRGELAELERTWKALGELSDVEVPAGLDQRVIARATGSKRPTSASRRILRWVYPLSAAAAVLVAVVVAFHMKSGVAVDLETHQIVKDMDVLQNLDVLEHLDVLEQAGSGVILLGEDPTADKSAKGGS
jgi:anti-sigma factor RsiW